MTGIRKVAIARLGIPKSNPLGQMPKKQSGNGFNDAPGTLRWSGMRVAPVYRPKGRDRTHSRGPIPNVHGSRRRVWPI
jgi:hypothetical protein